MPDRVTNSAHLALRAETAEAHERLHHIPPFVALAAGGIDRAGYLALLRRLFGFHAPVEVDIARMLAPHDRADIVQGWRRADLLRQDMLTLGMTASDITRLPKRAPAPSDRTLGHAMGWLYVLEGSTLGGRLLARQLDHLLPKNDAAGRLFFLAGGKQEHGQWRNVCAVIDEIGSDAETCRAMIGGALEAFAAFEAWFAEESAGVAA